MNPKIFVGVAVGILAVILGGILLMGPTMVVAPQENTSEISSESFTFQKFQSCEDLEKVTMDFLKDYK